MPDLTAFLLDRISEDQALAEAADPGPWHAQDGDVTTDDERWPVDHTAATDRDREDRLHIARWDPARVLAECETKRRIIKAAPWANNAHHAFLRQPLGDWILRLLAQPYADHPDFDPSWRPE